MQDASEIMQQALLLKDTLRAHRWYLHQHPELSFKEFHTSQYIQQQLTALGIPFTRGYAGTGIVAIIEGVNPTRKCIALRADMDALPIQEMNDVAYRSINEGVMHACGHDVHTTCLLGAASLLQANRTAFEGTFKLIFQPGEEQSPGGASILISEGVLENPKVDGIIGMHVYPEMPVGHIGFRAGEYMASTDELRLRVIGKGGHAAMPHKCVDPIMIAATILVNLQQVVSRKANALLPTVLSFGKIQGGDANNVIPDEVQLEGTLRTFDEAWRKEALALIQEISHNIATSFGGDVVWDIPPGYPSLHNNPSLTHLLQQGATKLLGSQNVHNLDRRMTAEDFSFYTHHTKGCFFRLGTNTNNTSHNIPVHNAHFDVDEESLVIGAQTMAYLGMYAMEHDF